MENVVAENTQEVPIDSASLNTAFASLDKLSSLKRTISIQSEYRKFSQVGDSFRGTFLRIMDSPNKRNQNMPTLFWVEEDRKVYRSQATILVDEVRKAELKVGDPFEVVYKGKKPTRGGNSVDTFDIYRLG